MLTRPPPASLPNSSSSASGRLILSWITRAIGRAPISGSKPCWASQSRAAGVADRRDVLLVQLRFQLDQELVHHAQDVLEAQRLELHHRIQPVAELRA